MTTIKYQDSLFYHVYSTAKYFDKLSEQFFKDVNLGITAIEHFALMIIKDTKNCCQRDLARLIIKDRANTGKLAKSLEGKGFIKIKTETKANKPVKILSITNKGLKLLDKSMEIIDPLLKQLEKEISKEIIENTKRNLENFKKALGKISKINI